MAPGNRVEGKEVIMEFNIFKYKSFNYYFLFSEKAYLFYEIRQKKKKINSKSDVSSHWI